MGEVVVMMKYEDPNREPDEIFKNYRIIQDRNKYGIETLNGTHVIDCVFDSILFHKEEEIVEFKLEGKVALWRVVDLPNL